MASKFLAGEIVPRWRVSSSLTRKFTRELVREELVGEKVSRQRVTNSRTRDLGNSGTREKVKPIWARREGGGVSLIFSLDSREPRVKERDSELHRIPLDERREYLSVASSD